MRPGEKLFEELFIPGEVYARTAHQKIFVANNGAVERGSRGAEGQGSGGAGGARATSDLEREVDALIAAAQRDDVETVRRLLSELVPEYRGGSG